MSEAGRRLMQPVVTVPLLTAASGPAAGAHEPAMGLTAFVCYAHDSPEHKHAVLQLAELLVHNGMTVTVDQLVDARRRDWGQWAIDHISAADFVLIVASPDLKAAADACPRTRRNLSVRSELSVIRDLLHRDREIWIAKLLPVLLPGGELADIPLFLQPHSADHYWVRDFTVAGAEDLLRTLTGQARRVPPCRGTVPLLPPLPSALAEPTTSPLAPPTHVPGLPYSAQERRQALPPTAVLLAVAMLATWISAQQRRS